MKLKVPDNLRVLLSREYLDWAEKLPSRDSGLISRLQTIRKHQRQHAKETYEKTRPSEGIELSYLSFRLIELFHIEEIDDLIKGLNSLFPGFSSYLGSKTRFTSDLKNLSETITGTGFQTVGFITSKENGKLFYPYHRKIESLPPEVQSIRINSSKIWPSAMIITLDVHLNEEATSEIVALQEEPFLPEVRFANLLPWKLRSHSTTPTMRKEIINWFNNLRLQVEQCIEPFIAGFFMRHNYSKASRLPAIEVFGFKGIPEGDEAVTAKWTEKTYGWWDSFGFKFYWPFYSNGQILFVESSNRPKETNTAYRIIALWDQYLKSIKSQHMSTERETVSHNISYVLDSLVPYISIHEFQATVQKELQKLRKTAFVSVHRGSQKVSNAIRLHNIISKETMNLKRMVMEFRQQKKSILLEMKFLKDMKVVITSSHKDWNENLRDTMIKNLEYQSSLLQKHTFLLSKSFADYLSARNTEAMYKLQRKIMYYTISLFIAAILSLLLANWSKIKIFLTYLKR